MRLGVKLSIIVPVYNMAADGKLEYCIQSLLGQTITDYEIIAVDDASTDNSLAVLREYEKRYPDRLRVIHYPENRRQGGAKNEGLRAATGEWIGFVDSDDWVSPDCYEKLLARAEETGADVTGCDYQLVYRHSMEPGQQIQNNSSVQTGVLGKEEHKSLLLRPGSMVIKIYRHSVLKEHQLCFPEGIFYEDNCAASLWSLYFTHFERVEEPLYYYYQHDASTVHHITEQRCRDRMRAAELFYEECKRRGFLEEYYPEIEYRFAELYYVITLFSYLSGVKKPKPGFVKELRRGMEAHFPGFADNVYYLQNTGEEEKKWIALQKKSDGLFFVYYRLKWLVRRFKAAKQQGKHRGKEAKEQTGRWEEK